MQSALTMEQAVRAFVDSRRAKNASTQTLFNYEACLGRSRKWAEGQGITRAKDVAPDVLRRYLVYLCEEHRDQRATRSGGKPLSSETVLTYFVRLRAFFRWLAREGLIRADPTARLDRPKVQQRQIPALSEAEAAALLGLWSSRQTPYESTKYLGDDRRRFLASRNKAVLALFLDTGARLLEAVMLNVEDVAWQDRLIQVMGKGGKERRIPFSATTLRILQDYMRQRDRRFPTLHGGGSLFLTVEGRPITRNAVRNVFRHAKAVLGLNGKRISPHVLRHSFARLALIGGADTLILQRMLGHASPVVTARYVSLLTEDLSRAHRAFSPVERLLRGR